MTNDQELKKSNELNNANILDISAQAANTAPTASDDEIDGNVAGTVYISPETLLANDADIDGNAVRGVSLQNAVNGEVHWDGEHVIFVPSEGYSGPASFEYTITDDKGGYDTATVNLNIVANSAPVAVDDSVEGYANTHIVIPATELLANDSDANGDALIGVSLQDAVNGTVSWDGENVAFTPDEGYDGPASFSYTIKDVHGETSTATVNLNILANQTPMAEDDHLSQDALVNQSFVILSWTELLENDHGYESGEWAYQVISVDNAVNGQVEFLNRFAIIFTPDTDYVGPASFDYTMTDGQGSQSTATAYFNVSANTAPVAADDSLDVSAYNSLVISPDTLLANDTDIDGDALTGVTLYDAENGKVEWDGANVIFTPNNGYEGPASFWYQITDSKGGYDQAKVNLTVKPYVGATDDQIVSRTGDLVEIPARYLLRNDIGQADKSIISVQNGENGNVWMDDSGTVFFSPAEGYIGPASFTYTIEGEERVRDTATVSLDVKPANITLSEIFSTKVESGIDLQYNIEGLDQIDNVRSGDYFFNAVNGQVEREFSPGFGGGGTSSIYFSPDDGFVGIASFDYLKVGSDDVIYTGTARYSVSENLAPIANDDMLKGVAGNTVSTLAINLLANDSDPEGRPMEIFSVQDAVNGQVVLSDAGLVTFTPDEGYQGPASYTYTIADSNNYQSTARVNLNIEADSDSSLDDEGEKVTFSEDTDLIIAANDATQRGLLQNSQGTGTFVKSFTIGEGSKVYDIGTTVYDFFIPNPQSPNARIGIKINADGSYQVNNRADDYTGALPQIHYTVQDTFGNETTSTLNLTVTNVNDAPRVNFDQNYYNAPEIAKDQKQLITTTETLLKYVTDIDGDEVRFVSVENGKNGTVELVGNEIYFTPTLGYTSSWYEDTSFKVTFADSHGATTTRSYYLVVNEVEQITFEAKENTVNLVDSQAITIPLNSLIRNDENVDPRQVSAWTVQDAVNGEVMLNGTEITFTLDEGYSGPASFTYTVHHDEPVLTSTAMVNLLIGTGERLFNAEDDTFSFEPSDADSYLIKLDDILANDHLQGSEFRAYLFNQQNVDATQVLQRGEFSGWAPGGNGTYEYIESIKLTPSIPNYYGAASFEYALTNAEGEVTIAKVDISFLPGDLPNAYGERLYLTSRETVALDTAILLKNDVDPNDDALSIVSVQNEKNGSVMLEDNQVTFKPEADVDTASFQYSIHDGQQNYNFAQVDVTVVANGNFVGSEVDDIMIANAENNIITAGDGDDVIRGGAGDDILTGGLGADTFVWSVSDVEPSQVTVDHITDFNLSEDKLDLKDLLPSETTDSQLADYLTVSEVNDDIVIEIALASSDHIQHIVLENTSVDSASTGRLLDELQSNIIYEAAS